MKKLNDSGEVGLDNIKELRQAADLSLRSTKETAHAIGHSMEALAAMVRHLWLNLMGISEKDRAFFINAPLLPFGLFGHTVNTVVERFQEAMAQSAAFKQFITRRRSKSSWQQPHTSSTSSSHLQQQKKSVAFRVHSLI